MRSLISKEYIKNAQVLIIKSLLKDVKMELSKVILSSGATEEQVKKILSKISELKGPIYYDEAAGVVQLTGEVDFQ